MAFKFDFKQIKQVGKTDKDPAVIREAIKEAVRGLSKKLKPMGASIELTATIDAEG